MDLVDTSANQIIDSMHQDYVQTVTFDTYGRRIATCSVDRHVRVWDLQEDGSWELVAQWQAHRGDVTGVAWAHPEFGSLLATTGSDHECKIWEERSHANASLSNRSWIVKSSLTEARKATTCLEFAPRHWGLQLAVGSADGAVRIYEAVDIMNLAQWPISATLQSFPESGCTCLSWCDGRFEPPTLVAGGNNLIVYRYDELNRSWQSLFHISGVSAGNILDVSWAPNVGRRYHYIASAENEQLRVHKLERRKAFENNSTIETEEQKEQATDDIQLKLESTQTIDTTAWRCQWNITGTILASSGDAGIVKLWKPGHDGKFEFVTKVKGDQATSAQEAA